MSRQHSAQHLGLWKAFSAKQSGAGDTNEQGFRRFKGFKQIKKVVETETMPPGTSNS